VAVVRQLRGSYAAVTWQLRGNYGPSSAAWKASKAEVGASESTNLSSQSCRGAGGGAAGGVGVLERKLEQVEEVESASLQEFFKHDKCGK